MDLLGKVIVGVDAEGPYARDALVALAKSGAAVSLGEREAGGASEDIANRIRRRGGKASVKRLAKEDWAVKLIRDTIGEFGRVDAIVTFASTGAVEGDPGNWRGFLGSEAARPAELLAGLRQARYPAEERTVCVVGVLLAPGDSPLTGAWRGLWGGVASSFTQEATGVRGVFTGLLVTGLRDSPGETVLGGGFSRLLALLISDDGMPMRGQVLSLAQKRAPEPEPEEAESPVEPEKGAAVKGSRPAGALRPGAYRGPRGTKQTR